MIVLDSDFNSRLTVGGGQLGGDVVCRAALKPRSHEREGSRRISFRKSIDTLLAVGRVFFHGN